MNVNDYKSVVDVSRLTQQSTRNVRRIIDRIKEQVDSTKLFKDEDSHVWNIHPEILDKFKPQRIRTNKFYAMTIDPCSAFSEQDLDKVMKYVVELMGEIETEIHYVVEKKKSNALNHLHCFVRCSNKRKLIQSLRVAFSTLSYHQSAIFDLESWKSYITKDNNNIKKVTN